ncbi:MAG: GTPase HflX [Proteiniphilum sp.]
MKDFITYDIKKENAVLVGLITPDQNEEQVNEYLDELAFLAETAGLIPEKRFVQRLDTPNTATFVGKGKLEEIEDYVKGEENEVGVVIFDDELSARQLRNIEKELKIRIMDRTSLILDIFAMRAQTAHAKVQVELAQYQYLLPRLTRMWTHLERQRGGGGTIMRGPGETQLETDRRLILDKISRLKEELKKIDKQKAVQRKNRGKLVRAALVGYTNVGKSTLMTLLSKSEVFAEDKLFATLDTTVRKVTIDNLPFLLTDTVGFIRKLPTHLVESFKSTLDEVREADILLHVVDISHPAFEEQIQVVESTLHEIDDTEKPTILVFNKIDAFTHVVKDEDDLTPRKRENYTLEELKQSWPARMKENIVFISAIEKENIEALRQLLYEKVKEIHVTRFPYNDFLYQNYEEG